MAPLPTPIGIGDVGGAVVGAGDTAIGAITTAAEAVTTAAPEIVNTVTEGAAGVANTAVDGAAGVGGTITSGAKGAFQTAAAGAGDLINSAGDITGSLKDWGISQMIKVLRQWCDDHPWVYAIVALIVLLLLYSIISLGVSFIKCMIDFTRGVFCCIRVSWECTVCCYMASRPCCVNVEDAYRNITDHPDRPTPGPDWKSEIKDGDGRDHHPAHNDCYLLSCVFWGRLLRCHGDSTWCARKCGSIPLVPVENDPTGKKEWRWYGKKNGRLNCWITEGGPLAGNRKFNEEQKKESLARALAKNIESHGVDIAVDNHARNTEAVVANSEVKGDPKVTRRKKEKQIYRHNSQVSSLWGTDSEPEVERRGGR